MPGREAAKQCWGVEARAALEACADGDTLDQYLECAWFHPSFFAFPASSLFFPPCYFRPSYEGSRGRRGLAGGNRDNKGFKTSELPTAKPLSRQGEARQPLPSQVFQPHQPWQKAGRTIILTIGRNRWPHSKMGLSLQQRLMIGLSLVLIAVQLQALDCLW